jgi:hypothetical protein
MFSAIVMAVDSPYPILGYFIGLVYGLFLFSMNMATFIKCESMLLGNAGNVLVQLPMFFLFYLICWFGYRLVKEVTMRVRGTVNKTEGEDTIPVECQYVRQTLAKSKRFFSSSTRQTSEFVRFIQKHVYESDPTFRYSIRILITVGVSAVCIWEISVIVIVTGIDLSKILHAGLDFLNEEIGNHTSSVTSSLVGFVKLIAEGVPACYFTAAVLSGVITTIHLSHLLVCYRKHMKRLYRGEKFFLPRSEDSPVTLVTASLRYSGYQIAYVLWGWIIAFVVFFLVFFGMAIAFYFRFISFLGILISLAPSVVFTIAVYLIQFVLTKFVLLQDRGKYVNIDNRRLFHVFAFIFFFYNTLIGIVSCLRRILTGLILGTMMLERLDRSTLPRGWESFDPGLFFACKTVTSNYHPLFFEGFKSYVGYILLEHQYSNPYVITFLHLARRKTKRAIEPSGELDGVCLNCGEFMTYRSRLNRNRWLIAYTLINNPTLLTLRNPRVNKLESISLLIRDSGSNRDDTEDESDPLLSAEFKDS